MPMTVREVLRLLTDDGWQPVPNHGGDIPPGTLNSILKQAGLK